MLANEMDEPWIVSQSFANIRWKPNPHIREGILAGVFDYTDCWPPSSQPDTEIVVSNCAACHSLDYIATQPRRKGPQFWRDEVTKMLNVYKAPIQPADADAVAAALTQKFG